MIPATQSREVEEILRQILCSGDPAELSIDLLDSDGRAVPREVIAAPLRDGDTVGVFGVTARADPEEPHDSATAGDLGLTERQLEVLKLLAAGKSTKQIADELSVTKTTVRNHIARILARLEVHTRVQAVLLASRAGLVPLPPRRPAGGTSDSSG
jgi:DNA-binding NarL/FixJ family response regulator